MSHKTVRYTLNRVTIRLLNESSDNPIRRCYYGNYRKNLVVGGDLRRNISEKYPANAVFSRLAASPAETSCEIIR